MAQARTNARMLLLVTALLALASLACFALPIYVIRPFRHQGAGELSVALFVMRIGPWLSAVCAIGCAVLLAFAWTRLRGWMWRAGAVAALLVAIAAAYLTRINVYEILFHHLDRPQFEAANRAHIDSGDMVIAIAVNGQGRAYPIREIAYHHVVNDRLGGVPVVATY